MSAPNQPVAGISIREFASRDGCDEKLVRRAVQNGRLTALLGGKLDPALVGTGWRKSTRRKLSGADSADKPGADKPQMSASKMSAGADKPPASVAKSATGAAALDLDNPDDAEKIDTFIQQVLRGDFADLIEAEKAKENGLALKHLLDGRRKAGSLISFKAAQDTFFGQARQDRDAWLAWAPRVATELAAEFDIESRALAEALTRLVHQHLTELGEPEFEPGRDDGEG